MVVVVVADRSDLGTPEFARVVLRSHAQKLVVRASQPALGRAGPHGACPGRMRWACTKGCGACSGTRGWSRRR
jgi:hypothetical protein